MTAPWFGELVTVVSNAAPVLGSVLGGPAGGIAGTLIKDVFGGATLQETLTNVAADPNAAEKLKELEDKHVEALEKLAVDDRVSAREMSDAQLIRKIIILVLIILIPLNGIALFLVKDSSLNHFLILTFGLLLGELKQVVKLYFGG
jgi:hypothetical protein